MRSAAIWARRENLSLMVQVVTEVRKEDRLRTWGRSGQAFRKVASVAS